MKKFLVFLALALSSAAASADPISAIASIATILGSGATVAGIAAGALSLTQGLMLAGGALGLAGSLTQNKKLQMLGGALGLAGGLGQLAGKLTSAAATGELASAGAEQLGQTASVTAPAEQVAAEVGSQAAGAAADVATDVATADMNSINDALSSSAATTSGPATPSTVASEFRPSQNYGPGLTDAGGGGGLADAAKKVGSVIRDNKELINLGSGLIKGAMDSRSASDQLDRRAQLEQEAQARYSDSVTGIAPAGRFVRPGVDVTAGQPQNPIRYVPRRGLIRSARGG